MKKVFLVCGVPGSGKTWVCKQLMSKFSYVPHDSYMNGGYAKAIDEATKGPRAVLAEVPFKERELAEEIRKFGSQIVPIFVIEPPEVVKARYEARERRPIPVQHLSRIKSLIARAEEWRGFKGTSVEVLNHLRNVVA